MSFQNTFRSRGTGNYLGGKHASGQMPHDTTAGRAGARMHHMPMTACPARLGAASSGFRAPGYRIPQRLTGPISPVASSIVTDHPLPMVGVLATHVSRPSMER